MLKNAFVDSVSNYFKNLNILKVFELRFLYLVNVVLLLLILLIVAYLISTTYEWDLSEGGLRERSQILFDRPFMRVRTLNFCGDRYIDKIQNKKRLLVEQLSGLHLYSDFQKILQLKAQIRKFNALLYPRNWYWRPKKNFITVYRILDEIEDFSWVLNRTTPSDHPDTGYLGYHRYKLNLRESYYLNKEFEPFYAGSFNEKFLLDVQRKQYSFSTESRFPYVKFDKLFETRTFVIYRSPPIKYILKAEHAKIPHFKNNMFGNVQTERHLLSQTKLTRWMVKFYDYFLKNIVDSIYVFLRIAKKAPDREVYHADVLRLSQCNKFHSPFKYTYYLVNKKKLEMPAEPVFATKNKISYKENLCPKNAELNYDTAPIPYNLIISNPYHDLEVPFLEYKEFKTYKCTEKEYVRLKDYCFNRCLAYNQKITFLFILIALLIANSILFAGLKISESFETAKARRFLKKVCARFNAWTRSRGSTYLEKNFKKRIFPHK